MTAEEKDVHYGLIDEIVKTRLQPLMWFMGLAVTLFGIVFTVFSVVLIDVAKSNGSKASSTQLDELKTSVNNEIEKLREERSKDYLKKLDYYQIEVREHTKIKEAFDDTKRSSLVLQEINERLQFDLGLTFINSTPIR